MTSAGQSEPDASTVPEDAGEDLWRNTVTSIPTLYGRLIYLASLRNPHTSRYEHHGLALQYGADNAHNGIRSCHVRSLREWMEQPLDRRATDLDRYVASPEPDPRPGEGPWMDLSEWRNLVPSAVRGAERKLFVEEAKLLIARLAHRAGASGPDRAA